MEKIRALFTPLVRERLYIVASSLMTVLVAFGILDGNQASQWAAVVIAAVTALFAVVNGEDRWKSAAYGVVGALAVLLQGYGILSAEHWAAIAGLVAALLGVNTAAAKAPTTGGKHVRE